MEIRKVVRHILVSQRIVTISVAFRVVFPQFFCPTDLIKGRILCITNRNRERGYKPLLWADTGFSHPTCAPIAAEYRPSNYRLALLQPHSISFNVMSTNPSPELKLLFETALSEFEKRAGTNWVQLQIIDKLVNCESADSVIDVLQEQAQAFRNIRGDDGKLMTWLKRTVNVLYSLSTSGGLSGAIGLVRIRPWHSRTQHDTFSPSALSSGECNLRWARYTFWRMCFTWLHLREFL